MVMIKTLLALTLAATPPPSADPMAEAQALYGAGTAMFDSADYDGAIKKFTEALEIVSSADGDAHTRLMLLWNIASAHEKQFAIDKDVQRLRQALQLYEQYKDFADESGDLGEQLDVGVRIGTLRRKIQTHDEIERNRANAGRKEMPAPPAVTPDEDLPDWRRPRKTGIALLSVGAAATIGGVVLAVLGSRYEDRARDQVDELAALGVPTDHPAWTEGDEFIAAERRKGNALMGVGGSLAVVGAAGMGVGAYYLVKSKRMREGRVSAVPMLAPGSAGILLRGKF